jgi:hypothetical protein
VHKTDESAGKFSQPQRLELGLPAQARIRSAYFTRHSSSASLDLRSGKRGTGPKQLFLTPKFLPALDFLPRHFLPVSALCALSGCDLPRLAVSFPLSAARRGDG